MESINLNPAAVLNRSKRSERRAQFPKLTLRRAALPVSSSFGEDSSTGDGFRAAGQDALGSGHARGVRSKVLGRDLVFERGPLATWVQGELQEISVSACLERDRLVFVGVDED